MHTERLLACCMARCCVALSRLTWLGKCEWWTQGQYRRVSHQVSLLKTTPRVWRGIFFWRLLTKYVSRYIKVWKLMPTCHYMGCKCTFKAPPYSTISVVYGIFQSIRAGCVRATCCGCPQAAWWVWAPEGDNQSRLSQGPHGLGAGGQDACHGGSCLYLPQ